MSHDNAVGRGCGGRRDRDDTSRRRRRLIKWQWLTSSRMPHVNQEISIESPRRKARAGGAAEEEIMRQWDGDRNGFDATQRDGATWRSG